MIDGKELTRKELSEVLGIGEWTLQRALDQLHIEGKRDPSDRRKVLFPPDTVERIRQWLKDNS